jgi:rubrerythrin
MDNRVMTMEDAFKFAFKEELRFSELYRKLFTIAEDDHTKELFQQLAEMEIGHVEKLKQMYNLTFPGVKPVLESVATPGNITGISSLTVKSGLEFAVVREEYAADHYFMMADMAEDKEVKKLLNELAEEEERHADILEHRLENLI